MLDSQTPCYRAQEMRINALLATLSPLLKSTHHDPSDVLPHAEKNSASCAMTGKHHSPNTVQRKLLETIATLCSLHESCTSAAVALEVTSDRATLHISTGDTPSQELRKDVETWLASLRDVAEDSGSDPDALSGSSSTEEHSETVLMASVYRACYAKIRARIREDGRVVEFARKLEDIRKRRDKLPGKLPVDDDEPDTPLGKLCTNLQQLVSSTEPETAEEGGEIRLAAACIAGWAADRAMREDWNLCRMVDGIDSGAIQIIREACVLSTLVDTLVTIAKCGGVSPALPLLWTVEWASPPPGSSPSESEAVSTPETRSHPGPSRSVHPESMLIRHIVDNALSVHPYIATSALPCYPCVMLLRAVNIAQSVGTESGTGRDFMLRGCDAQVVLPWSPPWSDADVADASEDVQEIMRELELGLERDLQILQKPWPGRCLVLVNRFAREVQEEKRSQKRRKGTGSSPGWSVSVRTVPAAAP